MNWITLNDLTQFTDLILRSKAEPDFVFGVFKHSTRCSISAAALNRMEREWETHHPGVDVLYLDLLSYRDISNSIAEISKINHQSPQLLIFKNGICISETTHFDIRPSQIHW
ncbi:MAG: bacillithiol system redox-active protein YtxJ [Flavobacteriales bacterium]|nr:bacillithiol system redox-active protein YtxJ [Flavobacteriales bacterium]